MDIGNKHFSNLKIHFWSVKEFKFTYRCDLGIASFTRIIRRPKINFKISEIACRLRWVSQWYPFLKNIFLMTFLDAVFSTFTKFVIFEETFYKKSLGVCIIRIWALGSLPACYKSSRSLSWSETSSDKVIILSCRPGEQENQLSVDDQAFPDPGSKNDKLKLRFFINNIFFCIISALIFINRRIFFYVLNK